MVDAKRFLALVSDAVASGNQLGAIDACIACAKLGIPKADVVEALRIGETRRKLGL